MTTASTTLLGLALPVTGELSGTWGDTVNNAITSLLDFAVAGTTTLSADADVTLTTTALAANQARGAIILWTAGGTVTRTITAPAQSKTYIVINKTSSTQSIVLRGVGPTTGVTILAGEYAICAWNGLDFVKVGNQNGNGNFVDLIASGNVGIGTTTPGAKLESVVTSTATPSLRLRYNATSYYFDASLDVNGNTVFMVPAANGVTSGNLLLGAGGSERMRINSSGNVLIGGSSTLTGASILSTPLARLDIQNNSSGVQTTGLHLGYALADCYGSRIVNVSDPTATAAGLFKIQQGTTAAWRDDLVIDDSGNVGLGNNISLQFKNTSGTYLSMLTINGANNFIYGPSGAFTGQHIWYTGGAEVMRIDSSGNVGIGTTSPASKLHIEGANVQLYVKASSGYAAQLLNAATSSVSLVGFQVNSVDQARIIGDTSTLQFCTGSSNTERVRIDSSGNLLVGTTSNSNVVRLKVVSDGSHATAQFDVPSTVSYTQIIFSNPNGSVGSIATAGSATSYNTSSDYRLKNTIAPMTGALAKVAALKPVTYKWNVDNSDGEGFVAHELAEIIPQCVTGEKDALDADGNPQYQGVDTSFLVATLTAAIQEQQALITSLTARIAALEAR